MTILSTRKSVGCNVTIQPDFQDDPDMDDADDNNKKNEPFGTSRSGAADTARSGAAGGDTAQSGAVGATSALLVPKPKKERPVKHVTLRPALQSVAGVFAVLSSRAQMMFHKKEDESRWKQTHDKQDKQSHLEHKHHLQTFQAAETLLVLGMGGSVHALQTLCHLLHGDMQGTSGKMMNQLDRGNIEIYSAVYVHSVCVQHDFVKK